MKKLQAGGRYKGVGLAFWLCLLCAAAVFVPFQIVDKGIFTYAGDFNSQQISFWRYCNDFVKTAGGGFSWATDLGSGFANSYSFYCIGSPFFWLSLLFPADWMPYLMCPLLCLKFAVSGAGAFLWLRRYAKTANMAVVGACLYAFSGFTVYNVFFNHFLDVIATFPFLLWALDEAVFEKKHGPFAVLVAINLLNNYFFFFGQVVFLLLYFFIKLGSGEYRLRWGHFGWLALEAVLGCLMGGVLLWPAMLSLAENPRTVSLSSGFGFLMYSRVQQYFAIFYSMFLPPDPCYMPNVFTDCTIRHTSLTAWLPVAGMCGVLAYLRSRKKTALRRLLFTCFFMAMVPVLNSAFYALNSSYYARWFYMPILLMCAATVQALEDEEIDLDWGIRASLAITLSFTVFGIIPKKKDDAWSFGVAQYAAKFWLTLLQAVLALVIFWCIWEFYRRRALLARRLLAAVLGFSVLYSVLHIAMGKFPQWEADAGYRDEMVKAAQEVKLPEGGFYRIDTQEAPDNVGLWLDKPNLRCFNSTVAPSIMEFYPAIGVKRDVSSKPAEALRGTQLQALRSFLGCRYLLTPKQDAYKTEESLTGFEAWTRLEDQGAYAVWENADALSIGFATDAYIPLEEFNSLSDGAQIMALLRAVALDEEQVEKYGYLLRMLTDEERKEDTGKLAEDLERCKRSQLEDVWTSAEGFGGGIALDKTQMVVFSVPYDAGFTAFVNGEETEVLKVDNGMMAVLCPEGENVIRFEYRTPLLREGRMIALLAGAAFAAYLALVRRQRKKAPACAGRCAGCAGCGGGEAPVREQPDEIYMVVDEGDDE